MSVNQIGGIALGEGLDGAILFAGVGRWWRLRNGDFRFLLLRDVRLRSVQLFEVSFTREARRAIAEGVR